ncbi:aminoglycoside N(6')-acetyltransferase type 1 [Novosphingobium sediminis]|uniref:Aminoglycoside N(6')-acetyltransferase type 1 n=1 Tax=Novosphingobium sediminis TaxID=707214 RepID=A0A512AL95_9SPHN|nr:aminoglycoside 6'-N-acetyltransferase [Novosphingobium sediminis]GEO00473.1 aminoglycoside N(6')-acetyltransferase type 1 [Novosphingobium sediminis]
MIVIASAGSEHLDGWALLRHVLWDEVSVAEHRAEAEEQLAEPERFLNLVALDGDAVAGFAEASIRHEYVNGCEDSPVLFLEGICVAPDARRRGIARKLVAAVADWGRAQGIREFASDTWHDDLESHAFHLAAGFAETERVVYFRQEL